MHKQQEDEDLKGKLVSVPAYDMINWIDFLTAMSKKIEHIEKKVDDIFFATCCTGFMVFIISLAISFYMR